MTQDEFLPQLKSWIRRDFPTMREAQAFFGLAYANYLPDMLAGRRKVCEQVLAHYGYTYQVTREFVER